MTNYPAVVYREGKWWMIRIPDIDGLTQARRLSEVEEMAKSLIAITLDVPIESVTITAELEAVEDIRVSERIDELHQAEEQAAEFQERARQGTRALARELAAKQVPMRDIGQILGVSFQRVSQLIKKS